MQIQIDTQERTLKVSTPGVARSLPLYSKEAFEIISDAWVKVGWDQKYPYTFSWLGRPIIQLPEDLIRIQEVIYRLQPDVILETGVAHGGSLVFYAGLCKILGKGRVVGIDIEIRSDNRKAIEAHELFPWITFIEGNAIGPETIAAASAHVRAGDAVLVILDSCHSHQHVLGELEAYSGLVSPGSYIVATDGVMAAVADTPRGVASWTTDNPCTAVETFLKEHSEFTLESPAWPFNESRLSKCVTHWPQAWLRRK